VRYINNQQSAFKVISYPIV